MICNCTGAGKSKATIYFSENTMKRTNFRRFLASEADFSVSNTLLASQRRCTLGAILAVCSFVALPVLTGRAQNALNPNAPAPAAVAPDAAGAKLEAPVVPAVPE